MILPYGKEENDGKLGRKDETMTEAQRGSFYLVRDVIEIKKNEMARAAKLYVGRSLAAIFVSAFVERIKESTMQKFTALVHKIAAEFGEQVPDAELWLAFLNSGYMIA